MKRRDLFKTLAFAAVAPYSVVTGAQRQEFPNQPDRADKKKWMAFQLRTLTEYLDWDFHDFKMCHFLLHTSDSIRWCPGIQKVEYTEKLFPTLHISEEVDRTMVVLGVEFIDKKGRSPFKRIDWDQPLHMVSGDTLSVRYDVHYPGEV